MTDFKTDEIITEEEHTREQELEDMSTFVLCKNALGDREMTVTNVGLPRSQRMSSSITTYWNISPEWLTLILFSFLLTL